jgi:4-amino-4-deoxy-L-arabinose transferase-like glycosyltransferase
VIHRSTPWLLLAIALSVVLSLPGLCDPFANLDESIIAEAADILLDGGVLYRDAFDNRAPVTYYTYALIFLIAGRNNMLAIHIALIAVKVGLVLLVAAIGPQALRPRGGQFAAVCVGVLSILAFPRWELDAFNVEWLVAVFCALGAWLLIRALLGHRGGWQAFLAGACFGLACMTKQPALLDFGAALLFLLVLAVFRPVDFPVQSRGQLVKLGVLLGLGFAATAGPIVAAYYFVGAWDDFVLALWTYNRHYYIPAMPRDRFLVGLWRSITTPILLPLGAGLAGLAGLAVAFFRAWMRDENDGGPRRWLLLYVAFWAVTSWVGACLSARAYGHYFIQLLPAWSLLAGEGFDVLLARFFEQSPTVAKPQINPRLLAALFVAIIVMTTAFPVVDYLTTGSQALAGYRRVSGPEEDRLVQYLRENTSPDDRILVWGFAPHLYVYTDRKPASHYIHLSFVVGLVPGANTEGMEDTRQWALRGSMNVLLDELRRHRPLYIIDTSPSSELGFKRYPIDQLAPLSDVIREHYVLDERFAADPIAGPMYRLFRRKD